MRSYVGIDAGGSGSRWVLLDATGAAVEAADGPPIQVAELGTTESARRVAGLLDRIASAYPAARVAATVVGLAGSDQKDLRRAIVDHVAAAGHRIRVVGDTVSGAAAALPERAGVALFAGTGSFAMARDAAGGLHRIGGRGNRVSDHGSGYRVVLAAAEAVFLADQGMAPAASARLRAALCDGLGVTAPLEFGVALRERSAAEVARCFGAVVDAAAAGDAVADLVLTAAVDALAAMARAAARVAGLPADAPIVLGGGTMRAEPYRSRVVAALGRAGCGGAVESLAVSPAMGAAFLARAVAAAAWSPLGGWVDG